MMNKVKADSYYRGCVGRTMLFYEFKISLLHYISGYMRRYRPDHLPVARQQTCTNQTCAQTGHPFL
jgi:hypothetical protein